MTLQALHEYCVKNPLDRVVYIHSKGTYKASRSNENQRGMVPRVVSSISILEQTDMFLNCQDYDPK
jgi:hypothetical protein